MILSLLQTEINCDRVYRKIYHHTSNLLVHCLVNEQECIGQRRCHGFVIKGATVKQVTLNVTYGDKVKSTLSIHKLYSKCH